MTVREKFGTVREKIGNSAAGTKISERLENRATKRAEKTAEKRQQDYEELAPQIDARTAELRSEVAVGAEAAAPAYAKSKADELRAYIDKLENANTTKMSSEQLDEHVESLSKTETALSDLTDLDEDGQKELYLNNGLESDMARMTQEARTKYAEQLAARMDNTLNFKKGTKKQLNAAHVEYMAVMGLRTEAIEASIDDADPDKALKVREAKLNFMLGAPADPTDPTSEAGFGEKSRLEVSVANQRKLLSGLYEKNEDGKIERTENGIWREAAGRTWRKWSAEKGWKGKAKKLGMAAAGGVLLGLGAGVFAGAGLAAAGIAVGTSKALRAAGTSKLEKAAGRSGAEEDAHDWMDRYEQDRIAMQNDPSATDEDLDRSLWDIRDRTNELNKTHKRTTAVMGATALVAGATAGHVLNSFLDGNGGAIGKTWRNIFGGDTVNATSGPGGHDTGINNGNKPTGANVGDGSRTNPPVKGGGVIDTNPNGVNSSAADTNGAASTPEHVVDKSDMKGRWVEQVYRAEGLSPKDYIAHGNAAISGGDLEKVTGGNGTFHYRLTPHAMKDLGLTNTSNYSATSTENVMKVLAKYSDGEVKIG